MPIGSVYMWQAGKPNTRQKHHKKGAAATDKATVWAN